MIRTAHQQETGQPAERAYQVVFLGQSKAPATATVNGQPTTDWSYDEPSGHVTVNVPATSCSQPTVVAISQTALGIKDIEHSTMNNEQWYSVDGRQLQGEPKTKGVYINNGRKKVVSDLK